MSGHLRPPGSDQPMALLSFTQYKASVGKLESVSYKAASEKAPYHPWYALDHNAITSGNRKCCSAILNITKERSFGDTEIDNHHATAEEAQSILHSKKICLAFLGEQGVGKSSVKCAILDRNLVQSSSSSSACTAFPTLITHKEGASDNTTKSDATIQYLNDKEIEDCAEEQARRYRDAVPRNRQMRRLASEDSDVSSPQEVDEYDAEQEEEEESEAEKEEIRKSAQTAEDFFNIIFNTEQNQERESELEHALEYEDIESAGFVAKCLGYARERLAAINANDGFTRHGAVADDDLAEIRKEAEDLWPLVKSVRLETGHILLKHNLCFLDLPGYGDDNQIRTALVEKFRELADFEVVVTPSQRIATSVIHNRYLTRSVRRLGVRNTLLVANKSDELLDDLPKAVNMIKSAPFLEAKKCLKQYDSLRRARNEESHLLQDYRRYVLKLPGSAYLKREEKNVKKKLSDKGVKVGMLIVSARQYRLCVEAPYAETPQITAEATGIPRLRQFLLELPAQTNYETLQYHVHEKLPDIVSQMQRILTEFVENAIYAEMRKDLGEWLPSLRNSLESAAELLVAQCVVKPWDSDKVEATILSSLAALVKKFAHPNPYWATFLKIIKERGIPVNGKAKGRNLNNEILGTMERFIKKWHDQTKERIGDITMGLNAPVQLVLRQLRTHLENLPDHPELAKSASDALETAARKIEMAQDRLRANLETSLRATYVHYTTETHIQCPIALAMRPIYHSVLDVLGGPGSYKRHRQQLHDSLCNPGQSKQNFPQVIAMSILEAQRIRWKLCCEEFVTEAMAQLEGFRQIADQLLDTGGFVKADHREIRDKLQTALPAFEASIVQIQEKCRRLEAPAICISDDESEDTSPSDIPNSAKRKRGE